MKKIITINLIFWCNTFGIAQSIVPSTVPIASEPQKRTNWCWAASIEMVLNFYNKNQTQCDIVNNYRTNILGNSIYPISTSCSTATSGMLACPFPTDCNCISNSNTDCNGPLLVSCSDGLLENNFINILKSYDLNSTQSFHNSIYSWDTITNNIDRCQPLILIRKLQPEAPYNEQSGGEFHATVINGYKFVGEERKRFINEINPLNVCTGGQSWKNYDDDDSASIYTAWVSDIKPQITGSSSYPCSRITIPEIPEPLSPCIAEKLKSIFSTNPISLTTSYFNIFDACNVEKCKNCYNNCFSQSPRLVPYSEISYSKLRDYKSTPSQLSNVFTNKRRIIAFKNNIENLQIVLKKVVNTRIAYNQNNKSQPSKNYWKIERFDKFSYFQLNGCNRGSYSVDINGTKIRVGNYSRPIRIVTYPTFGYIFNCFKYKNKRFCFTEKSIADLDIKGQKFIPMKPYKESELLEALYLKTQIYDQNIKAKYPIGSVYSR